MSLVVLKFGGTSVSTKERRQQALGKIISEREEGNDVVAVVSAMGRRGDPYATDTFLDMLQDISPRVSSRTKDLIAGCGETIAACLVAEELAAAGYPAVPVTGLQAGIRTDSRFTDGLVQKVETDYIKTILAGGAVAVVTGFQGYNEALDLVTLGRGGSDITAIVLGGTLEADGVVIYTDVPGIAFTDPRLVPSSPFLSAIAFAPMYVLAMAGAKVVHPRAVSEAIRFDRPFWVRSTFSDDPGTLIGEPGEAPGGLYGISLMTDVYLARGNTGASGELKALSCNEWFYKSMPQTESAIVEQAKAKDLTPSCELKEVGVVTLQWESDSGVILKDVAETLEIQGIKVEEVFEVPGGGAWVVNADKARDAVLVLYRAPLHR